MGLLEAARYSNEWIDPICGSGDANVHASIELNVIGELIGKARSKDDRIAQWVFGIKATRNLIAGAEFFAPFV